MQNDKVLKISIVIIFGLVLIGFFAIHSLLNDENAPMYTSSPATVKVTNTSSDPMELSLDTIFINIHAQKYKILKADIAFKMKTSGDKKILKNNTDGMRNAILQYVAFMDANQLDTEKGKDKLKQDLIDLMNERFSAQVETVYFKNFILSP